MRFLLLLLPLFLGALPAYAQEAPTDSTRIERPTFSMVPT